MARRLAYPAGRWQTWRRPLAHLAIVVAFVASALGYPVGKDGGQHERPQRAGEPVNPYVAAAHITAARVAMLAGDASGAQAHIGALTHDVMRSARVPDVTRPIDHEAARAAVRPLAGVRSAIWLDANNFVVMVDSARQRDIAMIDRVCLALEPLGDTLAVVVNLQDVTAKDPDAATTLSRNCQLPAGQRALAQMPRRVDVLAPELRQTFKSQQRQR